MELEIEALQRLEEHECELALWPCMWTAYTTTTTCEVETT